MFLLSKETKRSFLLYGLAVISGLLFWLSFPPYSFYYFAWAALVPLFIAVKKAESVKQAANLGALTGLILYTASLQWYISVFGFLAVGLFCVLGLFVAFPICLIKMLCNKYGEQYGWMTAPVIWVGFEYFRSEIWFLKFTWLALGFSQTSEFIAQSASIIGVYGISFFIVLSAVFVANGIFNRRKLLFVGLIIPVLFLSFGVIKLKLHESYAGVKVKVALIQDESYNLSKLLKYESEAIENNAKIIVWPEYSVQFRKNYKLLKLFKRSDCDDVVRIVGGFIINEEESVKKSSILTKRTSKNRIENFALVLDGKANILGRYDKMRPIPILEKKVVPGSVAVPISTKIGEIGVQLCYDLDFEYGTRKLAERGAQILLVPNLDPIGWGSVQHLQHSSMGMFRAIESGLWIGRSASSGISQIIDPYGRVVKSLGIGEEGVLIGDSFLKSKKTIYTMIGWIIGPLCLVCSIVIILLLFINRYFVASSRSSVMRLTKSPEGGSSPSRKSAPSNS